ncbi:allantoate amidohydrolase [Microbacterium aoyamense]|uniref:Allantoate amidohydrolase n=1 Tax=Microbacterium aoyamense TaxID=344166 RepID=A0ABN2PHU1_9MICO|nr:allantoate amidohydrolase [Microbacterium aoyamense]
MTTPPIDTTVIEQRFLAIWSELDGIGREPDPGSGFARFSWTEADFAMRAWFVREAEALGLAVQRDRNGNLWAWWDLPSADRSDAVVTGSHLDSVPGGGAFDGPLGVVSGLLAVAELKRRGVTPTRAIAVVDFTDEEGARFGIPCMGSRLLTGELDPELIRSRTDGAGITLAEAFAAAGVEPDEIGADAELLASVGAYVELHVEQGRALGPLGEPLGLATGIWPHGRWRIDLVGEPNHAGTTLFEDRRDPMLVAADLIHAARRVATEDGGRATVAKMIVIPNVTNGVPSSVTAWLDARAATDEHVSALVSRVLEVVDASAAEHRIDVAVTNESFTSVVSFDADLTARLDALLGGVPIIPTAAGHDAGSLSAHVPTAMVFVRNETGASHTPLETAETSDCVRGVEALARILEDLAGSRG